MTRQNSKPHEKAQIAVLVSGNGSNLQHLLDYEACGKLAHGEIRLVISNHKEAYALERARQAGKEALFLPRSAKQPEQFERELTQLLQAHEIDLIILAGFLAILSPDFIQAYPNRIINVHPSLIPAFCGKGFYGLKPHEAVLARGVKVTGATVHIVNEIPDGGPILLQKAVEVREGDTPELLQRRVMEEAEWILLPQAAELMSQRIVAGEI